MPDTDNTPPSDAASAPRERVNLLGNWISLFGLFFVGVGLLLMLTFGLFSLVSPSGNPYLDILGFMILPMIFVLGLVIVPIGVLIKYFRVRRRAATHISTIRLSQLDLNNPRNRLGFVIFLGLSLFVVLPMLGVSGYASYHYTESTAFCGQLCHSVMAPEATTHATSPHARVTCAECHIGGGADWYVKSKLSGLRQVVATLMDTYSRPIPPAITELRPARETCEECHWPAKFYGRLLKQLVRFSPDEGNTRRPVQALMKVGGADESIERVEGIHMHMLLSGRVEYVATDDKVQEIPWVKYTTADDKTLIYRSDGKPTGDPPPAGVTRTVDCMDCHNRAAHHFRSPQDALDLFLEVDQIDPTLPFIKREAIEALTGTYADVAAAEAGIEKSIKDFYNANYAEVAAARGPAIEKSIAGIQAVYRRNHYPEMRVTWDTYPDNIGHLVSPGCFRCHDGEHVSADGGRINAACDTCHTFLTPVPDQENTFVEARFRHSMNLDPDHDKLRCDQCHNGGKLPLCRDCHTSGEWLKERGKEVFQPAKP